MSDDDIEVFRHPKRVAKRVPNPPMMDSSPASPGLDTTGMGGPCHVEVCGEVPVNKNLVRFPTNATLLSQGKGLTVLIKPVGLNACTFLQNPVKLARGLRDSAYDRYPNMKVRTNLRRNLVAVEFTSISNSDLSTLLKVTRVGTWQVTCSQPNTDTCISGAIGPIHPSVEVSELLELAESGSVKIREIVQLPCHRHSSGYTGRVKRSEGGV